MSLSTCHMPSTEPNFGHHPVLKYYYGYFVYITGPSNEDTPSWLVPIIDDAFDKNCQFIQFDRDDSPSEFYQSWDW